MSYALLFSGQGTQHPAMLPWLADDAFTHSVCEVLSVADWRASLADAAWAQRNDVAQPLLAGLALAAWTQIAGHVPGPAAVAGYSVGELPAFGAAGVLDATCIVELAVQRAAVMDRSARKEPGGLVAVSGLPAEALSSLLTATGLAIAIRNGEESVILGGPLPALEQAAMLGEQAGAHCTVLRVKVPSHTPWMADAAQAFSDLLATVPVRSPNTVLFSNAADRISSAAAARQALSAQIATTVRWDECMDNIASRQVRCVLEVGPGQALSRMWSQRHPHIPARACDDFRSVTTIVDWLNRHSEP